ncbi:MAG: ComF family protein [Saprospiraceae bacterium]
MIAIHTILHDLIGLLYPNLCLACSEEPPVKGEVICLKCQFKLPKTNFHLDKENPFTERFWGRIALESGAALYHFVKGGRVQELLHQLKYEGKREIGIKLGEWYGRHLLESPHFKNIDVIVPVPLHPRKERLRGYNQAAMFAQGLATSMNKTLLKDGLVRQVFTETQTQKSRDERLKNVAEVFAIGNIKEIQGKHILLVDDVMTTGATMEACGLKLLTVPGTTLSMATIAIADF